jgi:hypothetical protein
LGLFLSHLGFHHFAFCGFPIWALAMFLLDKQTGKVYPVLIRETNADRDHFYLIGTDSEEKSFHLPHRAGGINLRKITHKKPGFDIEKYNLASLNKPVDHSLLPYIYYYWVIREQRRYSIIRTLKSNEEALALTKEV